MIKTHMQPVEPRRDKYKVSELIGKKLDWAVATALNMIVYTSKRGDLMTAPYGEFNQRQGIPYWAPSTDWAQGGPLIQRFGIGIDGLGHDAVVQGQVEAFIWPDEIAVDFPITMVGPTPLVACMRCLVADRMGMEIELTGELL